MMSQLTAYETEAKNNGFRFILGVDEAGRGPLAGPVVAAAVLLKTLDLPVTINDSKKMTEKSRLQAFHVIFDHAYVGIGIMNETAIDTLNILNASMRAMDDAIRQLVNNLPAGIKDDPHFLSQTMVLIDGNQFRTGLPYRYRTIISGDGASVSIAAASVIAKVFRDRIMEKYDRIYPGYGFGQHKGYPTPTHREAIKIKGPSQIHRRSFTLL